MIKSLCRQKTKECFPALAATTMPKQMGWRMFWRVEAKLLFDSFGCVFLLRSWLVR